jgi:hypothetical protein
MKSIVLIVIISMLSCTGDKTSHRKNENFLKKFEWLLGSWSNISEKGIATETWRKENDSLFSGEGFFVAGNDTVSSETISLEYNSGQINYIPTVSDQNDRMRVKFKLTSSSDNKWVFENPVHDFPQKIIYIKIEDDSLLAEISGLIDGNMESVSFPMKKLK